MKCVLTNRFVVLAVTLGVVIGLWNVYVMANNGGEVAGRVVDERGAPVPDAVVRLYAIEQTMSTERGHVSTSQDGSFRFSGNNSHRIQVRAEKSGFARSDLRSIPLYFRGQNVVLKVPLVIERERGQGTEPGSDLSNAKTAH